jgi:hypothetical protein
MSTLLDTDSTLISFWENLGVTDVQSLARQNAVERQNNRTN